MKFKLDENLPFSLKKIIEKSRRHQVDSVFHEGIVGVTDSDLVLKCNDEKRIIVTLDSDFARVQTYHKGRPFGTVLLRPSTQGKAAVIELFKRFMEKYDLDRLAHRLVIVDSFQIRIREMELEGDKIDKTE
ncbi:MAG TPA: DUF5615 family PIN-like protein [Candidatus Hodarchaeales archaeon]|nr:DUF5615 family PIN-like protein [Candidatus Hodarchaeales archaeon]